MATVSAYILECGDLPPFDESSKKRMSRRMLIEFDNVDEFRLAMAGEPVELRLGLRGAAELKRVSSANEGALK